MISDLYAPNAVALLNTDAERLRLFFDEALMVSSKMNYIYTHIPKSGCSTALTTLWFHEHSLGHTKRLYVDTPHVMDGSPWWLKSPDVNCNRMAEALRTRFVFTFVRNPFVRLLSCYLDKVNVDPVLTASLLKAVGMPERRDTPISFVEFVEMISTQSAFQMDKHWRPQTEQSYFGLIRYDFIGRVENYQTDMSYVLKEIFNDPSLAMKRGGTQRNARDVLEEYYDAATIKRVTDMYRNDFEAFGYAPELGRARDVPPKDAIAPSETNDMFLSKLNR